MTNIGTPDYQRGVVSAQALLATVAAGVTFATVGVPPNAESIIVVARGAAAGVPTSCYGVESSTTYPGTLLLPGPGVSSSPTWVYDVSAAIDNQVSVGFAVAPTLQWYIYSDAGVHITADLSKLTNKQGIPYYIPSAPSTASGDHPPNELKVSAQNNVAANSVVMAAPGAGFRYRIFYASVIPQAAAQVIALEDSVSGGQFCTCLSAGNSVVSIVDFKPTGVPLSGNAAVVLATSGGNGTYNVVYTIETI